MPDPTRHSVSATEAAALLDASPYLTRFLLYRRFVDGETDRADARMDWGKKLEPLCLAQAAEDLALEIVPNRDADGNQVYVSRGVLGCTRDAKLIAPDRGPLAFESKCCFDYQTWMREWDGGKSVPRHNEIQLQVQMYVGDGETPWEGGTIGVWCAGAMHYFQREPIPELWQLLEERAAAFLDDVKNQRQPDPTGLPIEVPLLATCFPTVTGKVLDLSVLPPIVEGDGAFFETEEGKRIVKLTEDARLLVWHSGERLGHERAEKQLKAELMAVAGEHDTVKLLSGVVVKVKTQQRKGFTVKPTTFKTLDVYAPEVL